MRGAGASAGNGTFSANLAGGGASVALALSGFVTDGLGPSTAFVGTFTTQFANMNALQILEQLATQGYVQSSYSAEFTVTASPDVPEPATLVLLGSGLFGATFLRRRQGQADRLKQVTAIDARAGGISYMPARAFLHPSPSKLCRLPWRELFAPYCLSSFQRHFLAQ